VSDRVARPRVVARRDATLDARVTRVTPMRYAHGADAALDRPAHVRAGSGIAWAGQWLAVVQDDANFLALVDPRDGSATAIPLPAGKGGLRQFDDTRGNKKHKLDLEALVSVPLPDGPPLLLALGSGSTKRRESMITLRGFDGRGAPTADVAVSTHPIPALYARLRSLVAFAGSELNVEAAVLLGGVDGGVLRLFNRGNGAARGDIGPVNATCDVDWRALAECIARGESSWAPSAIVQYDLGAIGGGALGFTDASLVRDASAAGERYIVYTAAAEDSPDTVRDGAVAGSAVGVIAERRDGMEARWAPLREVDGRPFSGKVEGIALHPDDPTRALVVVDRDVADEPSELCEVTLEGAWFA
jgi:hypothetical protein